MNNVHPLCRSSAAPLAPALRPFTVSIKTGAQPQVINVLAFTSCDAICNAIDIIFYGNEPMPADGLEIEARPMNILPAAA